ncbi:membrane protein insertion efficiency factor YidD [Opitutus terrae]|uniref:membrane protein insertion efficiency factor YidD n=1 Tax=Opitutus terrae TaxID=107709 RepID=UPI0009FEE240
MRAVAIRCVRVYQAAAPSSLRRSCLFTPSCSDYMIQAIEKRGVVRGVVAGLRRVCRCRQPNGGVDFP